MLKGSGVRRMREYKYVADPLAPYEVLGTHVLPYGDVRFLKYFEDVFERFIIVNDLEQPLAISDNN